MALWRYGTPCPFSFSSPKSPGRLSGTTNGLSPGPMAGEPGRAAGTAGPARLARPTARPTARTRRTSPRNRGARPPAPRHPASQPELVRVQLCIAVSSYSRLQDALPDPLNYKHSPSVFRA